MKLFGYYAWHSFVNQVRKMLKTWVLIFILVCMLIGGLIGGGAAKLSSVAEAQQEAAGIQEPEEEEEDDTTLAERLGVTGNDLLELGAGAVILGILIYNILSADTNGSKIFLPADVNLLFPSPMRPQSVLMFRLMTKLGTFIFLGFYLLLQLPNLILNLGMSVWGALALIAVWCLTVMCGALLQVLFYTISSTHTGMKSLLRRAVYGLLAALLGAWALFWKRSGLDPVPAAAAFFNAPLTRWLPIWGWLKGFFLFAVEGSAAGTAASFAALVAGGVGLIWLIHRVKADFYEDAMAKSEETAQLMEQVQAERSGSGVAFKKRKKDRADTLRRDGLNHGRGASVFFFKSLYNRFRFAHLGFFTKTMETYLAAAAGVALICRFAAGTDSVIPAALTLGGLAFFRSLGNPLEEDTKMDFFRMIPDSAWSKVFWSLLGGSVNCLLDALPGLLAAALIQGANPLDALVWLPLIVTVDFYATAVGAFINLSVPAAAGATIKQMVQVMFIYFGLLPDVAIMAVGMVMGYTALAAVVSSGVNMAFGLLFVSLTPMVLEPGAGRSHTHAAADVDLKAARRCFSRMGAAVFTLLVVGSALQIAVMRFSPGWLSGNWGMWLETFLPLYGVAVPLCLWIMSRTPASRPESRPLGTGGVLKVVPVCVFVMYAGNLLGTGINLLLEQMVGGGRNPVMSYAMDEALLPKILFLVILAPLAEETVFRRFFIDRARPYGEKLAVVTSALAFGLFHGNFAQFFYAFGLGLVFGYVYVRTGRLRCSVLLHMFINLIGGVVSVMALEQGTESPAFLAYTAAMVALALIGMVLLVKELPRLRFDDAPSELPRGERFKTVYGNAGMALMVLGCLVMFVLNSISG